jgi:hypothetical protein
MIRHLLAIIHRRNHRPMVVSLEIRPLSFRPRAI